MPATALWLFALGGLACARGGATSPTGLVTPPRGLRLAVAVGCLALLLTPALMGLSQQRLNAAVEALKADDCRSAAARALSAAEVSSARPEPFQVLSYCNSRFGEHDLAILMARTAVSRDREKWDSFYALALARAAAGVDPRGAARTAFELSPRNPLTQRAVELFNTDDPRQWKRRAQSARLPIL